MATARCVSLLVLLAAGMLVLDASQVSMPGGLRQANVNDLGVQKALSFAIKMYNNGSNDKYASNVVEVIGAQSQIVSGVKYYLQTRIARTTCNNNPTNDLENCAFHEAPELAKNLKCKFEVHIIPWEDSCKLLKQDCQPEDTSSA
ncbi:cystatin-like isoform X2 [Rhinatrema bivittatum]|uniref:cystatin-like isoform X2 n=1 Tax=Rhinatrema bivittatum TaxID=194408 RepID=UPI00112E7E29|nr:cystatin-like isoform X2 [Rhinatrema bivittatum]